MLRERTLPAATSLLLIVLLTAGGAALAQTPVEGHWQGQIDTPGQGLEIALDFRMADDGLAGTISIPSQGLNDLDLVEVGLDGVDIRFRIPGIPGDPSFEGTVSEDGLWIRGTFRQGGSELPFALHRAGDPADEARSALAGFGEVVSQALADFNVPGAALAVVAGGEVVFADGFGHRDREEGLPMTPDSLFAIGSTTKAMTATVLGMLVDEGKLDWDAPLRNFLPGFRLSEATVSEQITPRDLVTHRSGLPRHDLLWYNNNEGSRADLIERFEHLELSEDLRAKFQYNNLMFMTAGYLAGRLSGSTWEEAVRSRLFDPLGMVRTNFSVADSQADADSARPYRENDEQEIERIPFRPIDLIGPAGSVNSTVNEMSRWLLFNLRSGKAGERQLINASTLADVHSPQMTMGATPERPEISQPTYGMGWIIDTYRGHRRISHGGGIDGFTTSVMLFPDDDLGLVSFTNLGSPLPSLLNRHAADRILGLETIDWLGESLEERTQALATREEAEQRAEKTRVAGTAPSHPLADYVGDYRNPGYGSLRILREGEALKLVFNGIEAPLEHWHYDVWSGAETEGDPTFEDQKLLFRGDVDGNIASVEAAFEPRAAPIVFAKRPDERLFDPDYLQRFVGTYETPTGTKLTLELAGGVLIATVPGQPAYTLRPELSGRFVLEEVRIVSIGFEEDEAGRVTKALLHQPGAVVEALRVE